MVTWEYETEDGEEAVAEIPTRWEICSACEGEGKSSLYLGAITREDFERDWSYEEQEAYFAGAYDKPCQKCHGTGKVRVVDWKTLKRQDPDLAKAYQDYLEDEAAYEHMCHMERLMGA